MSYPKAEFIGVDIVDVHLDSNIHLPNVKFGYGNILSTLDFPDNHFDLVHMRILILALRADEWPNAVKEALRVVKPGGVLQLMEYDVLVRKSTRSRDTHGHCQVNGNELVQKGMSARKAKEPSIHTSS